MKATCRASQAPGRKGALFIHTPRGLQRIVEAKRWGKEIGLVLDDGRFVVVSRGRELLTTKGATQ